MCSPTTGMDGSSTGRNHYVGCALGSSNNHSADNCTISSRWGVSSEYWIHSLLAHTALPYLDCYFTSAYWINPSCACLFMLLTHPVETGWTKPSNLFFYQYCTSGHLLIANFNSHALDSITLGGCFLCAINLWVKKPWEKVLLQWVNTSTVCYWIMISFLIFCCFHTPSIREVCSQLHICNSTSVTSDSQGNHLIFHYNLCFKPVRTK